MHHTGVFVSYDYLFFDEVTGEDKKIHVILSGAKNLYSVNKFTDSSLRSE